jgi:two-component system, cell cycle response regulator CtrA
MRVLLTVLDSAIGNSIALLLKQEGHVVERAECASVMVEWARGFEFDLFVLDTIAFDWDGIAVLSEIRSSGVAVPAIFLSHDQDIECVEAALAIADDFVRLPVDSRELIARMNAIVRRANNHPRAVLECGDLKIDTMARQVLVGDEPVRLHRLEYRMLEQLLRRRKVVSKEELLANLYSEDARERLRDPEKTVEVCLCTLRKKLALAGAPDVITTLRGQGYAINYNMTAARQAA